MADLIYFSRLLTIEEHSVSFSREDVPAVLLPLFDLTEPLTVSGLTEEQNDAIDDLLGGGDLLSLGDTTDSSGFRVEPLFPYGQPHTEGA